MFNVIFYKKVYIRFVVFIDLFLFLVTFCKYQTKVYIHFIDFIGFREGDNTLKKKQKAAFLGCLFT